MSIFVIIQWVLMVFLGLAVFILYVRQSKRPKDDPRLSRGLQLLQSKIAVLEDLSDRTDTQGKQMMTLIEQRVQRLQKKMLDAEAMVRKIEQSMHKSLEVAEIFQDRIPHEEIIERKNTIKYVSAARLAHQGKSVEEISLELGIPKSEVEFIVKVNKDRVLFDEESLPGWVRPGEEGEAEETDEMWEFGDESESSEAGTGYGNSFVGALQAGTPEYSSLQKLGEEFRQACAEFETRQQQSSVKNEEPSRVAEAAKKVRQGIAGVAQKTLGDLLEPAEKVTSVDLPTKSADQMVRKTQPRRKQPSYVLDEEIVRKVEFPRIEMKKEMTKNLG